MAEKESNTKAKPKEEKKPKAKVKPKETAKAEGVKSKAAVAGKAKAETKVEAKTKTKTETEKKPKAEAKPKPKAKPKEKAGEFKVTLVKSGIGKPKDQKATIVGLGFKRLNQTVVLKDTPSIRGMVKKISHLVEVQQ